jgi:hypothetical protein
VLHARIDLQHRRALLRGDSDNACNPSSADSPYAVRRRERSPGADVGIAQRRRLLLVLVR